MSSISFNQIPIDLQVPGPYIEIDNSQAYRGLSGMPTKALVIGQMLDTGTADPLVPYLITRVDQAKQLFGAGSMLANMLERFKEANGFVECQAIAQEDDAAGVAATGSISFAGPATAAGTLYGYIAGRDVRVKITSGMTAAEMATALVAAIAAETDLPVTAAVDGAVTSKVNITARNKGECGNDITLLVNYYQDQETPEGVGVTIVALAGGTGNPDIADVFDAIGDSWYTDFAVPYTDSSNYATLKDELDSRWDAMSAIDGMAYMAQKKSHAQLITAAQDRNSQLMTVLGVQGLPRPTYELAAIYTAQAAYYTHNDPAAPLQTLPLTGALAPKVADRFNLDEQNLLILNGVSTYKVDADGTMRLGYTATTYRVNAAGAADPSYRDLEAVKTVSYLRYDLRTFIALRYARYKLADDGNAYPVGQNIVTPSMIKAALVGRFKQWFEAGLVENIDDFIENLVVERDSENLNRVNAIIPPDIINRLRVFAGKLQYRL